MLEGVVGDVAGGDDLAVGFGLVEEAGGQGDSVLGEFLGILAADGRDAVADGVVQTGSDFFEEQLTSLGSHSVFLW